jgi:oxalate decarboxylase/phosphoglucose isomerase-like protein (cupin superfamily)
MFVMSAAIFGALVSSATAQTAEPTYKGDPSVYKLLFEDANFRVIEATRKPGVHDKAHSHPSASVVYFVTDCPTKTYDAAGKATESTGKAGTARAVPVIPLHSAENTGTAECKQVFVEKK